MRNWHPEAALLHPEHRHHFRAILPKPPSPAARNPKSRERNRILPQKLNPHILPPLVLTLRTNPLNSHPLLESDPRTPQLFNRLLLPLHLHHLGILRVRSGLRRTKFEWCSSQYEWQKQEEKCVERRAGRGGSGEREEVEEVA